MPRTRTHQGVEYLADMGDGDMELPAELADIGDAQGTDLPAGDGNRADMAEWKASIRYVGIRYLRENIAGPRPHERQRSPVLGDIGQACVKARLDMIGDPSEVVGAEARARHDIEVIFGEACHGEIALDAAARIQHLGIGERVPAGFATSFAHM